MLVVFARKVGMTSLMEGGSLVPATLVALLENRELWREVDGAARLGLVASRPSRIARPQEAEQRARVGLPEGEAYAEIAAVRDDAAPGADRVAQALSAPAGARVLVLGVTLGKGFAGAVKRHGFRLQPRTHGGMSRRRPGSLGAIKYTIPKGKRMAGHMGAVRRSTLTRILGARDGSLVLKGSVPGRRGARLELRID